MGYGEYGGGGSVTWRVVHDLTAATTAEERDDRAPQAGVFKIFVNGQQVGEDIPFNGADRSQIRIVWSPDSPADAERDSAQRPWDSYPAKAV
jgi:hypothetical protein